LDVVIRDACQFLDVRGYQDESEHHKDRRKGKKDGCCDQKDSVSSTRGPVKEDICADTEKHEIYPWRPQIISLCRCLENQQTIKERPDLRVAFSDLIDIFEIRMPTHS
jgi:hypothetical protein